jgi:hypothetical protein
MMRRTAAILSGLVLMALPLTAQAGPRRDEQGEVRKDIRDRNVLTLRDIERRVLPAMDGMEYLGPQYDAAAVAYRLKFIRDGRVVVVKVDARSGEVLRTR